MEKHAKTNLKKAFEFNDSIREILLISSDDAQEAFFRYEITVEAKLRY